MVASFWVGSEVTWVGQQRGDVLIAGIAFPSFHHRHITKSCLSSCDLYYNYEKYPLSPLKPRSIALIEQYLPNSSDPVYSVHQSFMWFLWLNWRKSTFYRVTAPNDSKCWPIVKSRSPAIVTSQWPIVPAWLLCTLSSMMLRKVILFCDPRVSTRGIANHHHCANLSEDIELIKCLSDIFCRVCEWD